MNKREQARYKKGLMKEMVRLDTLFKQQNDGKDMPTSHYNKVASPEYRKYNYEKILDCKYNEIKGWCEIPVSRKYRPRRVNVIPILRKQKGQGRYTERVCNMPECNREGEPFMALDSMRSCPVCTNTKNIGDASSSGFDEFGIGSLGGVYK